MSNHKKSQNDSSASRFDILFKLFTRTSSLAIISKQNHFSNYFLQLFIILIYRHIVEQRKNLHLCNWSSDASAVKIFGLKFSLTLFSQIWSNAFLEFFIFGFQAYSNWNILERKIFYATVERPKSPIFFFWIAFIIFRCLWNV